VKHRGAATRGHATMRLTSSVFASCRRGVSPSTPSPRPRPQQRSWTRSPLPSGCTLAVTLRLIPHPALNAAARPTLLYAHASHHSPNIALGGEPAHDETVRIVQIYNGHNLHRPQHRSTARPPGLVFHVNIRPASRASHRGFAGVPAPHHRRPIVTLSMGSTRASRRSTRSHRRNAAGVGVSRETTAPHRRHRVVGSPAFQPRHRRRPLVTLPMGEARVPPAVRPAVTAALQPPVRAAGPRGTARSITHAAPSAHRRPGVSRETPGAAPRNQRPVWTSPKFWPGRDRRNRHRHRTAVTFAAQAKCEARRTRRRIGQPVSRSAKYSPTKTTHCCATMLLSCLAPREIRRGRSRRTRNGFAASPEPTDNDRAFRHSVATGTACTT
jgi:hypothetical protein